MFFSFKYLCFLFRALAGLSFKPRNLKPLKDIGRFLHQSNPVKYMIEAGNRIIVIRMFDKVTERIIILISYLKLFFLQNRYLFSI